MAYWDRFMSVAGLKCRTGVDIVVYLVALHKYYPGTSHVSFRLRCGSGPSLT